MATLAAAPASNAASILAYIDTAIGVATFLMSDRLPVTVNNIRNFFRFQKKEPPENFDIDDATPLIALLVIDPGLLEVLEGKVKNAIGAYRDCIKAANRPQEDTACDRKAERDVCDSLNRIMDRNDGVLPSQYLQKQRKSFGCVRVI